MNLPASLPRLKGFRFPREIVSYAVWAYHRFALSTADVEDLLAERGIIVTSETIRLWVNRFGSQFADCIRRDRPAAAGKWHLDEVVRRLWAGSSRPTKLGDFSPPTTRSAFSFAPAAID